MKGIIISLFMALLSGITVHAQTWISFDGSKEGKSFTAEILKSDANIHKVKIKLHGISDRIIAENGTQYHLLSIRDGHGSELMIEGEPQLPTITQLIAIPEGATYSLSVTEQKWQEVEMGTIYPAQRDSKGNDPAPKFVINESVYGQKLYAPKILEWGMEQNWSHIRCFGLRVCPFKYYPLQDKLSVLTEFVFQIDFTGVSDNSPVRLDDLKQAIDWHVFDNDISSFPVRSDIAKSSSDDYDYLIIVGNTPSIINSQALKDFTEWKAFKGYKTRVVSTTTTGTTPYSIKNYISQEITNGIKYVLFIGDQDKIPMKVVYGVIPGDTVKSDYWYGCLNDDVNYMANIPIGRFSVGALYDFQKMVEKTIAYESSYDGDYKKMLLVAHKEDAPYKYQGCCENIRTATYTAPLTFTTAYGASTTNYGNNATNLNVVNHINSGMHIVNYRGHGKPDSWGFVSANPNRNGWNATNQLFQSNQINNISTCSIYFNSCCQTGNIEEEPCMMESFMRSSKGAIACLAATEDTWTTENNYHDQQLFNKLLNDSVWHIGDMNVQAHIATIMTHSSEAKYNALSYLCGGDPTLEIWTGTPASFSGISVTKSGENLIVSSPTFTSGSTVCVVNSVNGELINRIEVSGYSCSFSIPSCNFHIVVNKHNYYPYARLYRVSGHIQNVEFENDETYVSTPLDVGYDVNLLAPYGNVVVRNGATLRILNGTGGVTIKNGFECEQGAELIIE